MPRSYSLYEAKTKLSEIVRQVREGKRCIITVHGKPVAEIGPLADAAPSDAERFAELLEAGIFTAAKAPGAPLRPGPRVPGALRRFLEDRE